MSKLNPELQNILDANGIDQAPEQNHLDDMFNNPMDQLEDLFKTFGRIFAPYEKQQGIKPKGWRKDQEDAKNGDPCK